MEIDELKGYHKNPRKMGADDFKLLSDSLKEFGDLSGIVFNKTTNELVGGNQRTNFFKQQSDDVKIVITDRYDTPSATGTVAIGYILFQGERFTYREVEWDTAKEERANIIANKVGGTWDFDVLANSFDIDTLLASGWKDFELGFATSRDEEKMDENPLRDSAETYLTGNIKQIVLYFTNEEFEKVVPRIDAVMAETGASSHTEAFLKLLEEHENA